MKKYIWDHCQYQLRWDNRIYIFPKFRKNTIYFLLLCSDYWWNTMEIKTHYIFLLSKRRFCFNVFRPDIQVGLWVLQLGKGRVLLCTCSYSSWSHLQPQSTWSRTGNLHLRTWEVLVNCLSPPTGWPRLYFSIKEAWFTDVRGFK